MREKYVFVTVLYTVGKYITCWGGASKVGHHEDGLTVHPDCGADVLRVRGLHAAPVHLLRRNLLGRQRHPHEPVLPDSTFKKLIFFIIL
jgi:hypothetical protein